MLCFLPLKFAWDGKYSSCSQTKICCSKYCCSIEIAILNEKGSLNSGRKISKLVPSFRCLSCSSNSAVNQRQNLVRTRLEICRDRWDRRSCKFAWKLPSNLWTKRVIFALSQAILHSYWAVYVQYWMIWHLTSNSFTKWVIFALYWVILHSYWALFTSRHLRTFCRNLTNVKYYAFSV